MPITEKSITEKAIVGLIESSKGINENIGFLASYVDKSEFDEEAIFEKVFEDNVKLIEKSIDPFINIGDWGYEKYIKEYISNGDTTVPKITINDNYAVLEQTDKEEIEISTASELVECLFHYSIQYEKAINSQEE